MRTIKIQCPAKINLSLKIINKREDGFHNIESIMQAINLYDYLDISLMDSDKTVISINGNSDKIPYNESNLVFKAAKLFLQTCHINNVSIHIFITKNIPVSAGLAGGSTDAAGTIFGLNKLFDNVLDNDKINELCAKLGSDLNFCLSGGRALTKGRGEILEVLEFKPFNVNLIKPISLGISAKEAYTSFAQRIEDNNLFERDNYVNDLEWAIINKYPQLQQIKKAYPNSIMTGSGSTYFSTETTFKEQDGYWVKNGLSAIPDGVKEV
ncbi:MAG: 4-(cytidine 5'-diphospho)-2-C-methyl-D-erythritol kinase [Muribaculaceae bacterium]|nr:4-(cytidine 5'-diphospho)-2-C-methyl-D-erythritol kinase [Muribaculaceae bacterium]